MARLEDDPGLAETLHAVRRTLGRLEADPSDPRLATRQFTTDELGHIRATPARLGDWYVFWQAGVVTGSIEIAQIAELHL